MANESYDDDGLFPTRRWLLERWRHDDVIKWKQFPRYRPFVLGNHRQLVNSSHKGQWRGALIFFHLCLNKRLSKQSWGWWFETQTFIWLIVLREIMLRCCICISVYWYHDPVNPLCAKFSKWTNIFTFDVIPLHWHETGSWSPSSSKTRTYSFYLVNIMVADVLATKGARESATIIFTLMNRIISVSARYGLKKNKAYCNHVPRVCVAGEVTDGHVNSVRVWCHKNSLLPGEIWMQIQNCNATAA